MHHVPKEELPNIEKIRELAISTLPDHYRLLDVRCAFGATPSHIAPPDFEVIIEYTNLQDEDLQNDFVDIGICQAWEQAITAQIRSEWSPRTIRIVFSQKATDNPT